VLCSFTAWSQILTSGYSRRLAGSRSFVASHLSAYRLSGEESNSSARFFNVRRPAGRLRFDPFMVVSNNICAMKTLCLAFSCVPLISLLQNSLERVTGTRYSGDSESGSDTMSICGRLAMNIQDIFMTTSSRDRHPHRNSAGKAGCVCNCYRIVPSIRMFTPPTERTPKMALAKVKKKVS
jgi:hypothetical protein